MKEFSELFYDLCGIIVTPNNHSAPYNVNKILEINTMYLMVTKHCNLSCKYCYISRRKPLTMSWEIAKRSLDILLHNFPKEGRCEIVYFGGEPLLNFKLIKQCVEYIERKLQDESKKKRIEQIIFSNGTIISDDVKDFLRQKRIKVIISLDGLQEVHDSVRIKADGSGTFSNIIENYKQFKNKGCDVGISMTLANHNIDHLIESLIFINDELSPSSIGFGQVHYEKNVDNNEFLVKPRYFAKTLETVIDELGEQRPELLRYVTRRFETFVNCTIRKADCPARHSKIVVDCDGTLCPCEALLDDPSHSLGHISDFQSSSILSNQLWNEWNNWKFYKHDKCESCYARTFCGGGCPRDAYIMNGSINSIDKNRCEQSRLLFNWYMERFCKYIRSKRIFFEKNILIIDNKLRMDILYNKVENPISYTTEKFSFKHLWV